jgi:hypothetical protein
MYLDMGVEMNGAAGAIMLVPEIIDNGALTKLDISNNSISSRMSEALQQVIGYCSTKGIELDSHESGGGGGDCWSPAL